MHDEQLRLLGEARIAEARPGGSTVAAYCLGMAGMVVLLMSLYLFLIGFLIEFTTGFTEARILTWIGLAIVGFGAACFVVAWGVYRGFRWGWIGAEMLTVLSIALAWSIQRADSPWLLSLLAAVLVVDQFAIQSMLWRSSVRRWFLQSHRVRAQGYGGMGVELKKLPTHETRASADTGGP